MVKMTVLFDRNFYDINHLLFMSIHVQMSMKTEKVKLPMALRSFHILS